MRVLIRLVFLATMLVATAAPAREVAGVLVPDTVTLEPGAVRLVLNGAGVRSKFFVKVYAGALYLPAPQTDAAQILRHSGAAAVHMHFLHSEVSREKLVDAWNDGFHANLTDAERAALAGRIEQFNALFRTVRKGDVIRLDYLPATGLRVYIADELRGTIEGADFFQAVLRIWLGDKPADSGLKRGMLGAQS
jgi:hypothetical protein